MRGSAPPRAHTEVTTRVSETRPTLPRSLRGTDIDGDFTLDAEGYFVADRYSVRVFDYFLTAEGEEDLSRIRERIVDHARSQLPDDQVAEVAQLFDAYLRYRDDVAGRLSALSAGDLRGGYEQMLDAQLMRWDSETAERLFGVDNRSALSAIEQAERSAMALNSEPMDRWQNHGNDP